MADSFVTNSEGEMGWLTPTTSPGCGRRLTSLDCMTFARTLAAVLDTSADHGSHLLNGKPVGPGHDSPLALPAGWDFAAWAKRNPHTYGRMNQDNYRSVEWRGAVFASRSRLVDQPAAVEVANPAYWQWGPTRGWGDRIDVDLTGTGKGAYLPATHNPYDSPARGLINWQRTASGSVTAPWMPGNTALMHFWAGWRRPFPDWQTAELATCQIRLTPESPSGTGLQAGIGLDYYRGTGHTTTKAPGPGIQAYRFIEPGVWLDCAWLTLPVGSFGSPDDLEDWLTTVGAPQVTWWNWNTTPDPDPDPPPPDPDGELDELRATLRETRARLLALEGRHERHTHLTEEPDDGTT